MSKLLHLLKITMTVFISLGLLLAAATFLFMKQAKFGQAPSGEHLSKITQSANYDKGEFRNLIFTPDLSEGYSMMGIMYDQLIKNNPRVEPERTIPSQKTDLLSLPEEENVLVWFGHSSYFIQLDGKKILVDPVFSGNASPIPGTVKAFGGTDVYSVEDLPEIDYLFISHDHYDHLDYNTIVKLKEKVNTVICGLGVGAHFERWGYSSDQITEQDWYDKLEPDSGFVIRTLPARHFSGRGFTRKNTLWASYLFESPSQTIYFGGDSGYDPFFAEIGEKYGPIDLAILDNGQYNPAWKELHLFPEEVIQATKDLKAKRLFPVHSSKFTLAMHPWDEPLKEVSRLNQELPIPMITPVIGEKVNLNDTTQTFTEWWEGID
jgi:L-ascorbate metabolism protein UlaG (beta-lactamase superfamily)